MYTVAKSQPQVKSLTLNVIMYFFTIADKAYRDMRALKESQSIIVSGEFVVTLHHINRFSFFSDCCVYMEFYIIL